VAVAHDRVADAEVEVDQNHELGVVERRQEARARLLLLGVVLASSPKRGARGFVRRHVGEPLGGHVEKLDPRRRREDEERGLEVRLAVAVDLE